MIATLKGKIVSKKTSQIILDVNGVGYLLHISLNTFEKISNENNEALVYTQLIAREDSIALYGFATEDEKRMFEALTTVSGIGPKLAINILSGVQIPELKRAIEANDLARIVAIPGVGKKTAERIVVELKDKVEKYEFSESELGDSKLRYDAVLALSTLGYNQKTAEKIIRDVILEFPIASLEEIIKEALKKLRE